MTVIEQSWRASNGIRGNCEVSKECVETSYHTYVKTLISFEYRKITFDQYRPVGRVGTQLITIFTGFGEGGRHTDWASVGR